MFEIHDRNERKFCYFGLEPGGFVVMNDDVILVMMTSDDILVMMTSDDKGGNQNAKKLMTLFVIDPLCRL